MSRSASLRFEDFRSTNSELLRHSCSSQPTLPFVIYMPPLTETLTTNPLPTNVSIQGIDNSSNIPQANYQKEDDLRSIESLTYTNLGEPQYIQVLEIQFDINKQSLQKEFYSEEYTPQRNWFLDRFKGSARKQIQEKFYKFLNHFEVNIPLFKWFEAYVEEQRLEYLYSAQL